MRSTRGMHATLPVRSISAAERKQEGGRNSLMEQLRVIILDTSPTSRKILEVILRREGQQVACFDDALEALRYLVHAGPADLLFLSLKLRGIDGLGVLKYLRGRPRFHVMA